MPLLKSKFFTVFLIVAQLAFLMPSVFAQQPKPIKSIKPMQNINDKNESKSLLDSAKNIDIANEEIITGLALTRKIKEEAQALANERKDTEAQNLVEQKANKLAEEYLDMIKKGDIDKQRELEGQIWEFLKKHKSAEYFINLVEIFIAFKIMEHGWSKMAGSESFQKVVRFAKGVGTAKGAAVVVIVGGVATIVVSSYDLLRLGLLHLDNKELEKRRQEYERELRRLIARRDSISVSNWFPSLFGPRITTPEEADVEIARLFEIINAIFKMQRENFDKTSAGDDAGKDVYKPSDKGGAFGLRFGLFNPIIKGSKKLWEYIF